MDLSGLLTSAGVNIGVCLALFIFYSMLRKQAGNATLYFGQRFAQLLSDRRDHFFGKLVPRWTLEAWGACDDKIMASGGLDAVIFLRLITFWIKMFSIAAGICIPLTYPLCYYGKEKLDPHILSMSLDVFTIGNIREGSKWLWVHWLALCIISCSACVLLYFENENIAKMRLEHIVGSSLNPRYFTVIVRAIPSFPGESYSDSVRNFFTKYYASSYLSHQMVYRSDTVQKLMMSSTREAEHATASIPRTEDEPMESDVDAMFEPGIDKSDDNIQECPAALVFFKSRYAALAASQVLQSANPMSWVTDLAPEPRDVYWKNLSIPYGQLLVRRMAILLASFGFMILFTILVSFIQDLLPEKLENIFPFLSEVLKNNFMVSLITGYLPSVVLMLFMCAVPPTMMMFSAFEGPISRSGRKKIACSKVLYFLIWNVFFVYVSSTDLMQRLGLDSSPKDMTTQLATTVPKQATFFMTYVMTSGWVSLACEIMRQNALFCKFFDKYILKKEPSNDTSSFPYHTEIPRVLLFGFLGFTYSPTSPLILPFLLVHFFLASLVYRNQILNVYVLKYRSGGQFWPMVHNTIIFSLVLTQVFAIGVFEKQGSLAAAASTVPLIIFTLLFNKYCRQRFHPVFNDNPAQVLIEMDMRDEQSGNMEMIHTQLPSAYCQVASTSNDLQKPESLNPCNDEDEFSICSPEDSNPGSKPTQGNESESLNPCNDDVIIRIPEDSNPGSKPTQGNNSGGPSQCVKRRASHALKH